MFRRRMRPTPARPVETSRLRVLVWLLVAIAGLGLGGCEEFNARRSVQEGNKLYKDGQFEKACDSFEKALKLKPNLEIAHHNLGLCYLKLFSPGLDTPLNKERADKAATHLLEYLKKHPKDGVVRDLITRLWIDSDNFEKALAFWMEEHKADPTSRDVISRLAGIEFKAGHWEEAAGWYMKDADLVAEPEGKVSSYMSVGNVCWSVLSNREKTVGDKRIRAADLGISALLKAAAISPKKAEVQGLLASIYSFRALAHGASFAAAMDRATSQTYEQKRRVLVEEAKKAQAAEDQKAPAQPVPADKPGG
jgi:tetratricopeptide (TPR) repeat protein